MKLVLVTISPSHYRSLIYKLMSKELFCNFIFGKGNTTVKSLDFSNFPNAKFVLNKTICGPIYRQKGVLKLVKDYDVIINDLGIYCLSSWLIMLKAKIRRQKIVSWGHGWYGREGFIKKKIKKLYYHLTDANLIYGNYAKELMVANGIPESKLFVIHNSLDYDTQVNLRNKIQSSSIYYQYFGNNNPVLCFIGRLTTVKKLDQVIDALYLLKKKCAFYNLVLIGDGPQEKELKKRVRACKLENQVWFYGACYDEKKNAELIYNADLCVAPGNIGLTAMHAMMFGCPCLSHDDFPWQMPEFEAIREDITGTFFRRENIQSLADSIRQWFIKHKDDREDIRQACFKEIDENWNPHKQIEIIKHVIESQL